MKAVLDHVGVAVRDLSAALAFYRDALGLDVEEPEVVASQRVRAHFLPVGESSLELLEATAPDSPIARYVDKRGPGLHHITLRVEDIRGALSQLKARGVRLIDEQPRPGAEGALVAFVHPSSAHGVLVELKEVATALDLDVTPSIGRYQVGDLELTALFDGFFRLDGGATFGTVPRTAWIEKMRPDDLNRVRLAARPLLIRGVRTLLVDAGLGDKGGPEFDAAYGVDRDRSLDHALAEAGISPEEIDLVLATHLRFDHAGGFTVRDSTGALRPRFPRARYVVRRGEWEEATRDLEWNRPWYRRDDFVPLSEAGVLELVDEDQTIMPGVRVRRTGGPTAHHQVIMIESGARHAAYVADIIPTTAHLRQEWGMAFDLFPMDTRAAKKQLVDEAIDHRTLVFFPHDPSVAAGLIRHADDGRRVDIAAGS